VFIRRTTRDENSRGLRWIDACTTRIRLTVAAPWPVASQEPGEQRTMNQPSHARGRLLSIGVKLAGATVSVVALLAVCVYAMLTRYERRNMLAAKEAAASMVARLYVATAAAPLTFGDKKGVQEVVGLLAANDDIVYAAAWAIADDGRGLAERMGELGRDGTVEPPRSVPSEMSVRRASDAVVVEAPVNDPSGKPVGVAQAVFSLAREGRELAAIERRILDVSIATSLLLSTILLFLARRVIVKPLARLNGAARALERGETVRIERRADDEIGELATAFTSMATAIEQRERRIAERNRDLRRVLDNVEDGLIAVDAAGVMSGERSRILGDWFGAARPGATLFQYFNDIAGEKLGEWMRLGWESLTDGFLPIEVAIDQLPKRLERKGRFYSLGYRPMLEGESLKAMLVVIRDVTERVELERAEQMQREMMVIFKHVLTDRAAFDGFFSDAARLVDAIEKGDGLDEVTLRRDIHTLKGNSAVFGLDSVARYCHELESRMAEDDARPTAAQVAGLRSVWEGVAGTYGKFSGGGGAQIVIDEDEQRELLRVIGSGAEARQIAAIVTSWRYERADARMSYIGEQVRQVARRLEKGDVEVRIARTRLRLPPQRWAPFWSVFGHVVRNAVDHGLEGPKARVQHGKSERGVVSMSFEERDTEVLFRFSDDGAGIDWDRVAGKAAERGLPAATRRDVEKALFADSVTTRAVASATSGRGVGLGAVLECVQGRGGSIDVESTPGAGTRWVFRFPIAMLTGDDAPAAHHSDPGAAAAPAPSQVAHVRA
jgi:two-component system, chemotaxis family, sensor kinase CheA